MTETPARLAPLIAEFDWSCQRLLDRMSGPDGNSGNGTRISIPPMTDEEYLWEPVSGCWSVRHRAGRPGARATELTGSGDWGRDAVSGQQPWPPPVTTIAWRLSHLSEMVLLRSDWTTGGHVLRRDTYVSHGDAASGIQAFRDSSDAWRTTLQSVDDAGLDTVGLSTYPNGSDAGERFIDIVWWVNQEILHHGAEIALLRDLWRDRASLKA